MKKKEKIFLDVDGNENVVHKTLEERLKTDNIQLEVYGSIIETVSLTRPFGMEVDGSQEFGYFVTNVTLNGNAHNAGIKEGKQLFSINEDSTISDFNTMKNITKVNKAINGANGTVVTLKLITDSPREEIPESSFNNHQHVIYYVTLHNLIVPQSKKERHKVRFTQTYNQIKLFNDDDRPPIVYNLSKTTEEEFNESILNFRGKIEFSYFQG